MNFLFSSEIIDKTEAIIKEFIPHHISINHKMYKISKESKKAQNVVRQKFFRKELNVWEIQINDSTYNYAILDNVKGKSMPITYLVIFNTNQEIVYSKIIKYREAYGGEVSGKKWPLLVQKVALVEMGEILRLAILQDQEAAL